jgi:hypothetical protein
MKMKKVSDLKSLYDEQLKDLKVDKKLFKKIQKYRLWWVNKNEDTKTFLGNPLIGTIHIKFSEGDKEELAVNILNVDLDKIKNIIKADLVEGLDAKWEVSTDTFSILLLYLMHRFYKSKDINSKDREQAIKELYYIYAYRTLGSLIHKYFPNYTIDEGLAQAAYERYIEKFIIKTLGSWQALIEYRAEDFIEKPEKKVDKKKHKERIDKIKRMNTKDSIKLLNAMKSSLNDTVNKMKGYIEEVKADNAKISETDIFTNLEEGDKLLAHNDNYTKYTSYIFSIFNNKNDFVNDDFIYVTTVLVPGANKEMLKESLIYLSEEYNIVEGTDNDIVTPIIEATFKYLISKDKVSDYQNDIEEVITIAKAYWSSSRVKDEKVKFVKESLKPVIEKAINRKTQWMITSLVIAVIVYIIIRSLALPK